MGGRAIAARTKQSHSSNVNIRSGIKANAHYATHRKITFFSLHLKQARLPAELKHISKRRKRNQLGQPQQWRMNRLKLKVKI
ncbi:hypothetical protein TTHERM_02641280 (macronuclear) [Tetrahymena thermophila SB210]|uniref:Uncharacterized protein n=1 Tax=Tetrahymena thermophila (strain SB210) TaxID=312017 RepID=Q223Q7_TETTS|nr:hypothetical protein TTHERM_02641280 [Tetrahymena thermophila SB210]EAR80523.2 hypothetical protein TTHERM_02641280 [Tetrahymena thermophila SB210]|eukprot:XP_001028186.2 hypothetical protein TTHERM_02641280 [Tetrahymena thermophila SB210]